MRNENTESVGVMMINILRSFYRLFANRIRMMDRSRCYSLLLSTLL